LTEILADADTRGDGNSWATVAASKHRFEHGFAAYLQQFLSCCDLLNSVQGRRCLPPHGRRPVRGDPGSLGSRRLVCSGFGIQWLRNCNSFRKRWARFRHPSTALRAGSEFVPWYKGRSGTAAKSGHI